MYQTREGIGIDLPLTKYKPDIKYKQNEERKNQYFFDTGSKLFKCKVASINSVVCTKAYRTKSAWNNHYKQIYGIKKPKCKFHCSKYDGCTRVFAQIQQLNEHIFVDHNKGSFKCKKCDKTFKRSQRRSRHEKSDHQYKRGRERGPGKPRGH